MTTGTGRYSESSERTPTAPAAGPLLPWGVENALCVLKWHMSKPDSLALTSPKRLLELAWSYEHRPPASWIIFVNSSIFGLKIPVSSGFVIMRPAVLLETAAFRASTDG